MLINQNPGHRRGGVAARRGRRAAGRPSVDELLSGSVSGRGMIVEGDADGGEILPYPGAINWFAVISFLLTFLMMCVAVTLAIPVLPGIKVAYWGDVGAAARYDSIIASVTSIVCFITSGVVGQLSDSVGRKPILVAQMITSAIVPWALWWKADHLGVYYTSWVVACIVRGSVGSMPAIAQSYFADLFPEARRVHAFAMVYAVFALSVLSLPITLSLVHDTRVIILIASVFATCGLAMTVIVPESLPVSRRVPFSYSMFKNPLKPLEYLKHNRLIQLLGVISFAAYMPEMGVMETALFYFGNRFGFTVTDNGIFIAEMGVMTLLCQTILVTVLKRSRGERFILMIGLIANVLHLVSFAVAFHRIIIFMFTATLTSLVFISMPALNAIASANLKPTEQGVGLGALNAVRGLCSAVGPILFGQLYAVAHGPPMNFPQLPFIIGACISTVAVVIGYMYLPKAMREAVAGGEGGVDSETAAGRGDTRLLDDEEEQDEADEEQPREAFRGDTTHHRDSARSYDAYKTAHQSSPGVGSQRQIGDRYTRGGTGRLYSPTSTSTTTTSVSASPALSNQQRQALNRNAAAMFAGGDSSSHRSYRPITHFTAYQSPPTGAASASLSPAGLAAGSGVGGVGGIFPSMPFVSSGVVGPSPGSLHVDLRAQGEFSPQSPQPLTPQAPGVYTKMAKAGGASSTKPPHTSVNESLTEPLTNQHPKPNWYSSMSWGTGSFAGAGPAQGESRGGSGIGTWGVQGGKRNDQRVELGGNQV